MPRQEQQPGIDPESEDDQTSLVGGGSALLDTEEKSIALHQAEVSVEFSGPLPPPQALKAYDMVVPGAAERIISMAERQQAHRHGLEKIVIQGDTQRAFWGLVAGTVFAFGSLGAGTYLISNGREASGVALVGTTLVSVVGTFIYGTQSRKTERQERQERLLRATSPRKRDEEES
jgi:uncharacterized membrane protein